MARCCVKRLNEPSSSGRDSRASIISPSYSKELGDKMNGCGLAPSVLDLFCLAWKNLLRVRLRMYLLRSLNKRKGFGLFIVAKLSPQVSRVVSAIERLWDDRLNIFTVCRI